MNIDPKDLQIDTYRGAQQSGWIFRPDQGVRITHKPTGISAQVGTERSQHANKAVAMRELERLLHQHAVAEASKPQPAGMLSMTQARALSREFFARTRMRRTAVHGGEAPAAVLVSLMNQLYTQAFTEGARSEVRRAGIPEAGARDSAGTSAK